VTIPAPNNDVARFLKQSKSHLAKLKKVFKDVATVQVLHLVSFEDSDDDDLEENVTYQSRPMLKVQQYKLVSEHLPEK